MPVEAGDGSRSQNAVEIENLGKIPQSLSEIVTFRSREGWMWKEVKDLRTFQHCVLYILARVLVL